MLEFKSQALLSLQPQAQLYAFEMSFKDRLKQARKASTPKVTQAELAKEAGVSPQAVSGWERGEAMPEPEKIAKIANFLGVTAGWLLGSEDADGRREPPIQEVIPAPDQESPLERLGPNTLPILGISMGGRPDKRGPDFWMNGETVRMAPRPRRLEGQKDVFGLYVDGSSMEPRYHAKDLVVVEKTTPAPGDDVVIELKSSDPHDEHDNPSFIKQFVSRRGSTITVKQFNPKKELTFDLKEIKNLFRVIPLKELMS